MAVIFARHSIPVNVPENLEEDPSNRFSHLRVTLLLYEHNQGLVILSGVLNQACRLFHAAKDAVLYPLLRLSNG